MTEQTGSAEEKSNADLDHALRDALRTEPLDPETLAGVRAAVENEWRAAAAVERPSSRSRRWLWTSLAATIAVCALALGWFARPGGTAAASFGSISRLNSGDLDVRFAMVRHHSLQAGSPVRVGDILTAQGPALISLAGGGTLRITGATVVHVMGANEIRLERGLIYVDKPLAASGNLRVLTRAGTVEHVGTEFEILSTDQQVRVRVREGRIRLRSASGDVMADAGTELLATSDGKVVQHSINTYGRDWLWVAALAPEYEIEGHPLVDFLQWVSRELGQPVKFADEHAREVAEHTILHGTVHGRAPLDALANVLATTTLVYEMHGETIWVQSSP
jgi:ferric-dicitrate binding protein FerR (iron transport regulator)